MYILLLTATGSTMREETVGGIKVYVFGDAAPAKYMIFFLHGRLG